MTLKQFIKKFSTLPNRFEVAGSTFEIVTGNIDGGGHSMMCWEMKDGKRFKLHCITFGETLEEAKEKMKKQILKQ